jgi:ribosomal protein L11 methyltransferase
MPALLKTSSFSEISIITTAECEEPVAALLERLFSIAASSYCDAETKRCTVTAYLRSTPAQVRRRIPEIRAVLAELRQLGLDPGAGEIRIRRVKKEDWAESWKKHFKPIAIGNSFLIKPSWSKLKPMKNQAVVILDPGLSFGTGQHATTSFCLREIVRQAKRLGSAGASPHRFSLLDIGCGSGILAISAAKLGYAPVDGFDFDPMAVKIALKNSRLNGTHSKISITRKDLTKLPLHSGRKYDVICANLISPLLIAQRDRIVNRLAAGGTLILAGILASEFSTVQKPYEQLGLKLFSTRLEREWRSGAFQIIRR